MKSALKKKTSFSRVLLFKKASILLDGASVFFGFYLAHRLYFGSTQACFFMQESFGFLLLLTVPLFLAFYLSDIYPRYRYFDNLVRVIPLWKATAYALVFQWVLIYALRPAMIPGAIPALFFEGWAITLCKLMITFLARVIGPSDRALLVGYVPGDERYFDFLKIRPRLKPAVMIIGVIGLVPENNRATLEQHGLSYLGDYSKLDEIVSTEKISTLVISPSYDGHGELQKFLMTASQYGSRTVMLDDLCAEVTQKIPYTLINKAALLAACLHSERYAWIKKKRVLDFGLTLFLSVLLALPAILIAIAIKIVSPGPIFYSQPRVGFRGREIRMYKFRTMRVDAEKGEAQLTVKNDPRVTSFGKFLRKTHLDEIPQLWNILKGEMSFVGPRPERRSFIEKIEKKIPQYALRLYTKPGITGWAQVEQGYTDTLEGLKEKFSYDLYYVKNMELALDVQIILSTIKHLILAKGQ